MGTVRYNGNNRSNRVKKCDRRRKTLKTVKKDLTRQGTVLVKRRENLFEEHFQKQNEQVKQNYRTQSQNRRCKLFLVVNLCRVTSSFSVWTRT